MVLCIVNQQYRLGKVWQKQVNNKTQGLPLRLSFCGQGQRTRLRCIKFPISIRAPRSLVTRCGPDKRSGRFQRIHAEANLPQNPGPDRTGTRDLSSHPNRPIVKLGWPLLLAIASACFIFCRFTSPSKPKALQLTPGQAAVALVSETQQPCTPQQRPAGCLASSIHSSRPLLASVLLALQGCSAEPKGHIWHSSWCTKHRG